MSVEGVPAITLTDPSNAECIPSPAQSPIRSGANGDVKSILPFGGGHPHAPQQNGAGARPATPSLRLRKDQTNNNDGNRPESASNNSTWSSPVRLIRTLSSSNNHNNNNHNTNTTNGSSTNHTPAGPGSGPDVFGHELPNGDRSDRHGTPAPMDPLSEHIMKRTNALSPTHTHGRSPSVDGLLSRDERRRNDSIDLTANQDPLTSTRNEAQDPAQRELKKGVKAVSFLSRLMGATKKKDHDDDHPEADSSSTENRPEGNDAQVFTEEYDPVDNLGYSPHHPRPPAYIKVRSRQKKFRDFDHLFLAQELDCQTRPQFDRQNSSNKLRRKVSATQGTNTIWAMEFSKDGKYLAAAGVDMTVRVWAVLSSSEDRQQHERQESNASESYGADAHAQHLSAPVFVRKPIREYDGHTATVLDLSWSKNNFLLSSSMDKTVRLWHLSRAECLCTFKHNDFVTSIAFHPKDDRFFVAGSLDAKLRLWSIPDKNVAYSAHVGDMITAVAFTPDGKMVAAGSLSGLCVFYETDGFKYQTRTHVRSTRGANAKGSKITGIQCSYGPKGIQLLITSNDSRVRLYNHKDQSLELKLKGNENNYSQIRATFSDDGRYVICGSEDRKAYIWSIDPEDIGEKRDRAPVEMFEAHDTITTVARFAPTKTRLLLGKSEDPVYDLCNPPPVTLLSRSERPESLNSWRPDSDAGSIQPTPRATPQITPIDSPLRRASSTVTKESPAYQARAAHRDGHIIVTADYFGRIKVFRQDCAWKKRKQDDWDRSSIFTRHNTSGRLSRTASIATRSSQKSQREPRTSMSTEPGSARILSWRMSIGAESSKSSIQQTSRSISPRKSIDKRPRTQGAESPPKSTKSSHPLINDSVVPTSPPATPDAILLNSGDLEAPSSNSKVSGLSDGHRENPLAIEGGRSYHFWDSQAWKERSERMRRTNAKSTALTPVQSRDGRDEGVSQQQSQNLRPPITKAASYVSRLSDEHTDHSHDEDDFDDAQEEQMRCANCEGTSFSARRTKEGAVLACRSCGTLAK